MPSPQAEARARQHQRAVHALQAAAAVEFVRLWPNLDWSHLERVWPQWVRLVFRLVRARHGLAVTLATRFLADYRTINGIPGAVPLVQAPAPSLDVVTANLQATVRSSLEIAEQKAQAAPRSSDSPRLLAEGRKAALTRGTGAVTRQVAGGARDTVTASVREDRHARGWARVSDGDPCAFCAMLISRGPVYKSAETAGANTQWHDHDGCTAVPVYGDDWPGRDQYERYEQLWISATQGYSGKDALNAFRRAHRAHRAA